MTQPCIGILGMGDMGSALAASLASHGIRVITTAKGRSEASQRRAMASGALLLPDLREVVAQCDIFLSVVPSGAAENLAQAVAGYAEARTGPRKLIFVDCNAITPDHSRELAGYIRSAGQAFVDASIIGPPPGVGHPRLYACGDSTDTLARLDGMGFSVRVISGPIGSASALKMLFAGLNKGFNALAAMMLSAAEGLDLGDELKTEIDATLPALAKRIETQIPYLPVNAPRYVQEMQEIAEFLHGEGYPAGFHIAAADVFTLLGRIRRQDESRETFDRQRTARDVARSCANVVKS